MNTGHISVRYATALLEFAKETNTLEKVYHEAKLFALLFDKMRELRFALENPVLPTAEKKQLILNAAGGETSLTFRKFTDLLLANKRENQIRSIIQRFIDLYREDKNIHYGKLITAAQVDDATEKRLTQFITDKVGGTLELEKTVDPDILGGFMLQVNDIRWDASISGQLKRIKSEYIERNKRIV